MEDFRLLVWTLRPWGFWNLFVLVVGGLITWWFYHRDNKQFSITKSHSRQLLNSIPIIWTSLGIFGTFCAICISLNSFSRISVEGTKIISELIKELIPAFSTSVYGIIGSIVTTIVNKIKYQKEEFTGFEEFSSPEKTIKNIELLLIKQQELSRQYNEQLTTNILSQSEILRRFVNDFVDRMGHIFEAVETSIERQVQAFGQTQFEQSRQVLENMTQQMSEVSAGLLAQQRDNIQESMNSTRQQLGEISDSLTSMIENISATSSSAIQALSDQQQEKLTTLVQNQKELSARLFEESTRTSVQMQEKMQRLGEQYAASNEEMLRTATEQNRRIAEQLNESLSSVVSQISGSVRSECNELSASIRSIVSQLNESYEFINDHIAEIKSNYEQATSAYRDAVQNAHSNNEAVEKSLIRINENLEAIEATNNNIKAVLALLETRQTNIDNLTQRIREVNEAIISLQNLEATLNRLRA